MARRDYKEPERLAGEEIVQGHSPSSSLPVAPAAKPAASRGSGLVVLDTGDPNPCFRPLLVVSPHIGAPIQVIQTKVKVTHQEQTGRLAVSLAVLTGLPSDGKMLVFIPFLMHLCNSPKSLLKALC